MLFRSTTAGGQMKLLNLAKRVHDLLKLTKLYTVFQAFEDEASAVDSFMVAKADWHSRRETGGPGA